MSNYVKVSAIAVGDLELFFSRNRILQTNNN